MTEADEAGDFHRLLRAFSCAALDPRLDGVLLFGVPQHLTEDVTGLFAAVMAAAAGPGSGEAADRPAAGLVRLGPATREDDLWSRIRLRPVDGRIEFETLHGDLVESAPAAAARIVVVQDLSLLSLPGLRAAVTLLGAETASVERHVLSVQWRPRARWLAFCQEQDAGGISPHLLDRFPVRLTLPDLRLPAHPVAAWRSGREHRALVGALAAGAGAGAGAGRPSAEVVAPGLDEDAPASAADGPSAGGRSLTGGGPPTAGRPPAADAGPALEEDALASTGDGPPSGGRPPAASVGPELGEDASASTGDGPPSGGRPPAASVGPALGGDALGRGAGRPPATAAGPELGDDVPASTADRPPTADSPPSAGRPSTAERPSTARRPAAATVGPALDEDALALVVELTDGAAGGRRALALGRIARVHARLAAGEVTGREHVLAAARLIGLPADVTEPGPDAPREPAESEDAGTPAGPVPAARPDRAWRRRPAADDRTAAVSGPGPAEPLGALPAPDGRSAGLPYPEDAAEPLGEFAPLRAPWRRAAHRHAERGVVVGVRPADDLRDLALVPTVVEAARNQLLPGRERSGDRLTVTAGDLRSYARAAEPERMLILLLDHTCRGDWDWQEALEPYLDWAYTARAAAAVVQVGGRNAPDELRAEAFVARNVLDPQLFAALRRAPGRATPLAHGLVLAGGLVRRAFQQQPTALAEAWLVVATDGRGNVPLQASLTGRIHGPVGSRGVEDALSAARRLGELGRMRLHVVVVDVGADPYADLPFALAEELGGIVVAGPDTPEDTLDGTSGDTFDGAPEEADGGVRPGPVTPEEAERAW